MQPIYAYLITALLAVGAFVLYTRARKQLRDELQSERDALKASGTEVGRLTGRLSELEPMLQEKATRIEALTQQLAVLSEQKQASVGEARHASALLAERIRAEGELRVSLDQKELTLADLSRQFNELTAAHANTLANLRHMESAGAEIKQFVNDAQTKLSAAFAELGGKTFAEKAEVFEKNVKDANTQSRVDIESLLKPFATQLTEFRNRVDLLYAEEARERSTLVGAVNELKTLNQDMTSATMALTRALKGSAKVRGDWGELMLESVLRSSGLEEGKHYDRQKTAADDEGARLHPDIVVKLPDGRLVVIDSKVNLIAWQEAMNAETPDVRNDALRRHALALRQHMRDLAGKNYPRAVGDNAFEMTIAFVPIEGALSAAVDVDQDLQSEAFEKKIAFASPNTLMATLRLVERLWTRDKIQRKALAISDAGGKLVDALVRFLEHFSLLGRRIKDADQAFSTAQNALDNSPQAAIPRARRLAALGARGRKPLPVELTPEADDEVDQPPNLPPLDAPTT